MDDLTLATTAPTRRWLEPEPLPAAPTPLASTAAPAAAVPGAARAAAAPGAARAAAAPGAARADRAPGAAFDYAALPAAPRAGTAPALGTPAPAGTTRAGELTRADEARNQKLRSADQALRMAEREVVATRATIRDRSFFERLSAPPEAQRRVDALERERLPALRAARDELQAATRAGAPQAELDAQTERYLARADDTRDFIRGSVARENGQLERSAAVSGQAASGARVVRDVGFSTVAALASGGTSLGVTALAVGGGALAKTASDEAADRVEGKGSKGAGEVAGKLVRNTAGLVVDAAGGAAAKGVTVVAQSGAIGVRGVAVASSATAVATGAAKRGIQGQDMLDGRAMLVDGTVGLVTGGVGQKLAPAMAGLGTGTRAAASGALGAASGAGAQVAGNWATGRALGDGVGEAALGGGFGGLASGAIGARRADQKGTPATSDLPATSSWRARASRAKTLAECDQQALMGRSTLEAYTTRPVPDGRDRAAYKAFTRDPESWHPQRRQTQDRVLDEHYRSALELDAPITAANGGKTLIVMRGNSGSGKSTALREDSPLMRELGIAGTAAATRGPVNPDAMKPALTTDIGGARIATGQAHVEAVMLADRLTQRLMSEGRSLVVDRRFGTASQIDGLAKSAKEAGYKVVVVDLDAELATSMNRVRARPLAGDAPNVPAAAVQQGYQENRAARAEVARSRYVDRYAMLKSDLPGTSGAPVIVTRDGNEAHIRDLMAWRRGLTPGTPAVSPALVEALDRRAAGRE